MDKESTQKIKRPTDWPANQREAQLSNVLEAVQKFIKTPNYKNKEIMFALVSQSDLNEGAMYGLHRITDYEAALMNELYLYATSMSLNSLKLFLYRQIYNNARMQKSVFNMRGIIKTLDGTTEGLEIVPYRYLFPTLRLFYLAYANFNLEKTRTFADQLVHEVTLIKNIATEENFEEIARDYSSLLCDLSWVTSAKVFPILRFDRKDLHKLFGLLAVLVKAAKLNPLERPLKGVMKMAISNWILKSRNNYNEDSICKCLSDTASKNALRNNEIWMQDIKYLNDKREQVVIKELYKTKKWLRYDWAKKVDFNPVRTSYVSSFCKGIPSSEAQQEYGKNIYGYKSDRIVDVLTLTQVNNKNFPRLGQVICFDISYNLQEARDEINYLCDIINLFKMSDNDKNVFFDEIIQYWFLSFKDKRWSYEKERRYQIFVYPEYTYADLALDERFLKVKSTIFAYPDFISKENNNHRIIRTNRIQKVSAISSRSYRFCNDCLQADYDNTWHTNKKECSICGSNNTQVFNKE